VKILYLYNFFPSISKSVRAKVHVIEDYNRVHPISTSYDQYQFTCTLNL